MGIRYEVAVTGKQDTRQKTFIMHQFTIQAMNHGLKPINKQQCQPVNSGLPAVD
jgi:hypothetical protein